jgi:hypothetical protein
VAALGLLLLALVLRSIADSEGPEPPVAHRERPARQRTTARSVARDAPLVRTEPGAEQIASNRPPRITSATLDRSRLCTGESTLLRVTAEDPDDSDLRYRATYLSASLGAPRFGFGRWLRFQAPDRAGTYGLVAVVEDPTRARDEVPLEVQVEDCAAPPPFDASQLRMKHSELDAQVHEFDLGDAQQRARQTGRELVVSRWHFGDGETQEGGLEARHAYPVVLSRRYSYYLVQAEVSVDGVPARIEYGLSFYSYAAANLESGYVALAADVERGDDTRQTIEYVVTFSNLTPFAASADELELVCLDAAGVPQARWRERLDLTVPGETSLEQTLTLDRQRCPGGASYELLGHAESGYAVGGLWSYKLRPSVHEPDVRRARERARLVLEGGSAMPAPDLR